MTRRLALYTIILCSGCATKPLVLVPPRALPQAKAIELTGVSELQREVAARIQELSREIDAASSMCCSKASTCESDRKDWAAAWASAQRVAVVVRSSLSTADKRDALQQFPNVAQKCAGT